MGSALRVWWLLIINPRLLCIIYFMYTFHRSHWHLAVIKTTVEMRINTFNRVTDWSHHVQTSEWGWFADHWAEKRNDLVSYSLLIYTFRYKHSYLHLDRGLEGQVVQEFPPQWFKNRHRSGLHSMLISLRWYIGVGAGLAGPVLAGPPFRCTAVLEYYYTKDGVMWQTSSHDEHCCSYTNLAHPLTIVHSTW